eukprot:TRINITY_DN2890_c0_g1_i1.p2 TRINITY_DN2890_c0_g1~~TRINITY_DN2890_c0_g1_i1.p2  ORF type:complete len:206 (-),score=69.46 TRINITY_DN2890_c0_g1_i1:1090-1707(-)
MTQEEKLAHLEKLKQQIAERKKEREMEDSKNVLNEEKVRRQMGKERQKAQELWEQQEAERQAAIKRREKELDKLAKARIQEKLLQDKLNRDAEERERKSLQQQDSPATTSKSTQSAQTTQPKKEYTECTIQMRFPDGSRLESKFDPQATINDVVEYIKQSKSGAIKSFTLSTTYPRKEFVSKDDLSVSLQAAGLAPRGLVVVNIK